MHISTSPEVFESGNASTLEIFVVRDFLYFIALRICAGVTYEKERSYDLPSTCCLIFLNVGDTV